MTLSRKTIGQASLLVGLAFLFSCKRSPEDLSEFSQDKDYVFELSRDVELTYSDSAKVRMKLSAPLLRRFKGEGSYVEMPEGVIGETFNPRMERVSLLRADYAKRVLEEQATFAQGNVVLINNSGDTLFTEEISWYEREDSIHTDQPVTIRNQRNILKGKGLVSNASFSKYKILNPTGVFSLDEPEE